MTVDTGDVVDDETPPGEEAERASDDTLPEAQAVDTQEVEVNPENTDEPWQIPDATLYSALEQGSASGTDTVLDDFELEEEDDEPKAVYAMSDAVGPDTSSDQQTSASLGDKIAAVEAAIAQADDQWEPDEPGMGDNAGTEVEALAWDEARAPQKEERAATDDFVDSRNDDWSSEIAENPLDAVIDEDMLRDIVAEIVREELQGVLGERITRNVRKLVRREIQRALTVQEFD